MGLPTVNIPRLNGQLNRTQPVNDAVACIVLTGVGNAGGAQLMQPYRIFDTNALIDLGIDETTNPLAFSEIADFYEKTGNGAELNFMLVSDATLLADICDKEKNIASKLIDSTEGRCVIFAANRIPPNGYAVQKQNGLDADVWNAVDNLNELAKSYDNSNTPFVAMLPGIGFSVDHCTELADRNTMSNDYVAISLACSTTNKTVSMGMLCGVIANRQVQRNIARVADGAVTNGAYFPDGTSSTDSKVINVLGSIHDKGYIFLRKIADKAGYFFNDDPTFTKSTGDFTSISWNRVINKSKRICFLTLIEKLMDDIDINTQTGQIEPGLASDWESDVENAIRAAMIRVSGNKVPEISGVKCTVNLDSDINNDIIDCSLQIVRKGQAKTINVNISYAATV
ncbi:DUF2586 family protein [Pinibacter soli]|uniref:DUF2586 family protein n=1 Tax=Pinibacter soli TaxID=3044211 RepID=A0ABT6R9B2_9BACT|nr:DUF2586 family protein [Pinibacter soli]MDI3319132.1 DUF2586 family protein [Pinibacter soli]